MKHITNIQAIGIKAKNFSHALYPVTVLTGNNAAGKTAVADAIKVAVLGYHPALGKQPGKTITLAPATESLLATAARFSDGTAIERSFKRTATGASVKVAGDEIGGLMPAQLHFEEFLAAKPTDRHAILSKLMGTVDTDKLATDVARTVAELGLGQFGFRVDPSVDGNPITPLVEAVGEQAKFVGQSVKQARATLATLVAVAIPDPVDGAALKEAEDAAFMAQNALGAAKARNDEMERRFREPMPEQPAGNHPTDEDLAESELRYNAAAELVAGTDIEALRRALIVAQDEHQKAQVDWHLLKVACADVTVPPVPETTTADVEERQKAVDAAINVVTATTALLGQEAAETRRLESAIASIEVAGKCPCCGSEGDHLAVALDALKQSHDRSGKDAELLHDKLESSNKALELAKLSLKEAKDAEMQWSAYRAAVAKQPSPEHLADLEARIKETEQRESDAANALAMAMESREQLAKAEAEVKRLADSLAAWEAYKRRKAERPTIVEAAKVKEEHDAMVQAADAARSTLTAMQARKAAYDQAVADQQRISDLKTEADTNEALAKKLKTFKDWLQEQERDATEAAMGPLLKISSTFINGVVDGQLAVQGHQLGIRRDGQFLPLEVLSGMECAAVAAACQAAMASTSPLRLIIVDELGRMTDTNVQQFWQNCEDAVKSGIVDQVILIDPHANRYKEAAPDGTFSVLNIR